MIKRDIENGVHGHAVRLSGSLRSGWLSIPRQFLSVAASAALLAAAPLVLAAADPGASAPGGSASPASESAAPGQEGTEGVPGEGSVADSETPAAPVDPVIARGEYIARAGNCAACHTTADGQPYAGGVAFQTPFGKIYSTNITPDPDTGIGSWTSEQFLASLREGVRPDGAHLYPVFPYTSFTKITDEDAEALFAYLKSVPAVNAPAQANEMSFPFNQRYLMAVWKWLFFDSGAYQPDASKPEDWNRGAYLVEALGHCSACHAPRNFLGAEKSEMTGGEYLDKVKTGELRSWSAPNLTAASNGLGNWSVDDIATYLKTGRNDFTDMHGPMNEVIMLSTSHLTEEDTRAMATYLKSLPANEGAVGSPAGADVLQQGETLYNVHCGTCHLPTGLGGGAVGNGDEGGARLAGSPTVQASNPASLINVILYGPQLSDPPLPKRWKTMEAYGDKLADEEVAALASYLRNAWGNKGGAVTADQVAKQR